MSIAASDQNLIKALVDRLAALEARVNVASTTVPAVVTSVDSGAGTATVSIDGVAATVSLPAGYRPSAGDVIRLVAAGGDLVAPQIPAGAIPVEGLDPAVPSSIDAAQARADQAYTLAASASGIPDDGVAPAAPTGFAVTAGVRSAFARWDANTEPDMAQGYGLYELQWSTDSGFTATASVLSSGLFAMVQGLTSATTYWFRVRAKDANGDVSDWSSVISGQPALIAAADIGTAAVTATKVADGSVTTPKLVAGSVTTDRLAANAVTTDKLAANSVTADQLAANSVTAGAIEAGAIDGTTIDGNEITGATITGSTLQTAASGKRVVIDSSLQNEVKMYSGAAGAGPGGLVSDQSVDLTYGYVMLAAPTASGGDSIDQSGGTNNVRVTEDGVVVTSLSASGVAGVGLDLITDHLWLGGSPTGPGLYDVLGAWKSWTPNLNGAASTARTAVSWRLGQTVTLQVVITGSGTQSGSFMISGLPYAPRRGNLAAGVWQMANSSAQVFGGTIRMDGSGNLTFYMPTNNALGVQSLWARNLVNAGNVLGFTLTYEAA